MDNFKLANNTSTNNKTNQNNNLTTIQKSLWRKGKEEYKKFGEYNFKKSTFWRTTLGGMLYTLICLLPAIFLMTALFNAYWYRLQLRILLSAICWGLLLISNGLSNYFTVEMSKTYITDDPKLQQFDAVAIMFYNCFNIGFMICSLVLVIVVIIITIGLG